MKKSVLAILFSSLFLMVLAAPTLALIDSSFDVVMMIDVNEEEQKEGKEGKESKTDMEWKVWQPTFNQAQLAYWNQNDVSDFYSNSYNRKVSNAIYTPPEQCF